MNKTIRVSYIITTKNRAKYLKRALENIREFLTSRDELLIIDGGSTDKTREIVKKNKDIVSIFISEKDFGEAHALNKGILLSSGKYIKILTDDDYFYPQAMKKIISIMERDDTIDALQCGGESYIVDEKTGKAKILFYEQVFPDHHIASDLLHVTTYCPCGLGLFFRRRVIARTGLFDTTFRGVDLGFISRLIQCHTNFLYCNISLYHHYNYSHSGENLINEIHRDEARVYIEHHLWEQTLRVETPVLSKVLGLDQVRGGKELLQSLKLLDFLRRRGFLFPIILLSRISQAGKTISRVKSSFRPQHILPQTDPIPPVRDNRLW